AGANPTVTTARCNRSLGPLPRVNEPLRFPVDSIAAFGAFPSTATLIFSATETNVHPRGFEGTKGAGVPGEARHVMGRRWTAMRPVGKSAAGEATDDLPTDRFPAFSETPRPLQADP